MTTKVWLCRIGAEKGVCVRLPQTWDELLEVASITVLGGREVEGIFTVHGRRLARGELSSCRENSTLYVTGRGETWLPPPARLPPPAQVFALLSNIWQPKVGARNAMSLVSQALSGARSNLSQRSSDAHRSQFEFPVPVGTYKPIQDETEEVPTNSDRIRYLETLSALKRLQKWTRRRRWKKLLQSHIPVVKGCCGAIPIFPIYRGKTLLGYEGPSSQRYVGTSLYLLGAGNPIRKMAIFVVEWPWFDRLSLLAVLANCLMLALQGPPGADAVLDPATSDIAELAFAIIFTVELCFKTVAMGFLGHENSYLASSWNRLDCLVVVASWLPLLVPELNNVSSVRAVRALRPLRTISRMPSLKCQVDTLLASLPHLRDVGALSGFILVVFGVLGLQLYKGSLLHRCYEVGSHVPVDAELGVCSIQDDDLASGRDDVRGTCAEGLVCRFYGVNPLDDTVNFDSILAAWVTIFQCITLEGWTEVFYLVQKTSGFSANIYFIGVIALGAFYVLNLFVAVMWHTYATQPQHRISGLASSAASPGKKSPTRSCPRTPPASAAPSRICSCSTVVDVPGAEGIPGCRSPSPRPSVSTPLSLGGSAEGHTDLLTPKRAWLRLPSPDKVPTRPPAPTHWSQYTVPWCEALVNTKVFNVTFVSLILINVALMMCEKYPPEPETTRFLELSNLVITFLFAVEMILKLLALSVAGYWADAFNRFDGFIVIASVFEIVSVNFELPVNTQVLRAFRILRIFKLLRSWKSLQKLLTALAGSLEGLLNLLALLTLILFIFGLLGMQVFGNQFHPPQFDVPPRANFDSIVNAMLTSYIIATGESWNEIYVDVHRACGPMSILVFIALIVLANYMLLNLVVALILCGFQEGGDNSSGTRSVFSESGLSSSLSSSISTPRRASNEHADNPLLDDRSLVLMEQNSMDGLASRPRVSWELKHFNYSRRSSIWDKALGLWFGFVAAHPRLRRVADAAERKWEIGRNYSFCCLSPTNPVRSLAGRLLHMRIGGHRSFFTFDNAMIVLILVSSLAMGFDSCDLAPDTPLAETLVFIDLVSTSVFVLEMMAKMIYKGVLWTPHAYLANAWDRFDGLIVVTSLISIVGSGSPAFRVMRILRVLRPLRLIQRFAGMKLAVTLLLKAMPKVVDVLLICVVFLVVFAILGVQLFGGKFASCVEFDAPSKTECFKLNGTWANPPWGNFDNFFSASLLLFEMSSLEGWPDVLYRGIDATEVDVAPQRDAKLENSLYFVLWIVLGSYCLLNLFVGVLVTTFYEIRAKEEGLSFVSEAQKRWGDTMGQLLTLRPVQRLPCPPDPIGSRCWRIAKSRHFDAYILCVILLNTLLMGLDGYGIPPVESAVLDALNNVCTAVFIAEAAIKIYAFSFRLYLKDAWNVFDFSIVLISIIDWGVTVAATSLGTNPTLMRVLRMVRVARVLRTLRVVKSAHGLKMLLSMLILSLPALGNILGIFLLVLLVYSLLAMQLFGDTPRGEFLNDDANFCHFGVALFTMFRSATGEGWNGIMHDIVTQSGAGDLRWTAIPFFVTYVLLSTFIVLKMMIAIILENFVIALKADSNSLQFEHAEYFLEAWAEHDPEGTGRMHVKHLASVIRALPPPLGLDPANYKNRMILPSHIARYVYQMDLRSHRIGSGQPVVLFRELLACLAKDSFREDGSVEEFKPVKAKLSKSWGDVLPPAKSKLGMKLYELLEELDIYRKGEQVDQEGYGGESIAATIIVTSWTERLRDRIAQRNLERETSQRRSQISSPATTDLDESHKATSKESLRFCLF